MKRAISWIMLLVLLVSYAPLPVAAAETATGVCGANLTWSLDEEGTLTISGIGKMDEFYDTNPWYAHREKIVAVVIEEGVTSIGNDAFLNCGNIKTIYIPSTLLSIDGAYESVFEGLTRLDRITVAEGNPNFHSDDSGALYYDPHDALVLAPDTLEGTFTVPDGISMISQYAFADCKELTGVVLPDSVGVLGNYAFANCSALKDVKLPDYLTRIPDWTFMNCTSLVQIGIPDSVTEIRGTAFSGCTALKTLDIPAGVTGFSWENLYSCTSLEAIRVAEGNTRFIDLDGIVYRLYGETDPMELMIVPTAYKGELTIPANSTIVKIDTMSHCTGLTKITVEEGNRSCSVDENGILWTHNGYWLCKAPNTLEGNYAVPVKAEQLCAGVFNGCAVQRLFFREGCRPSLIDNSFLGLDAEVFYPKNMHYWTEETLYGNIRKDYGGTVTWIPYDPSTGNIDQGLISDSLSWKIDLEGLLTVSGQGVLYEDPAFAECSAYVKDILLESGVTEIAESALSCFENVKTVTVSETVGKIGPGSMCPAESITFLGDAPEIDAMAFDGIAAVCYYPRDNDTWTGAVRQDYGGSITWRRIGEQNGWAREEEKWVFYLDGEKVVNQWIKSAGCWYFLDEQGYMVSSQWIKSNGKWFFLGANGAMAADCWMKISGSWYHFDVFGGMEADKWIESNGKKCYLGSSGAMVADRWMKIDGEWYLFDEAGYAKTSQWLKSNGKWCYLFSDGRLLVNRWARLDGIWYHFDANGYMETSRWIRSGADWCYLDATGAMVADSWAKINGSWYHFDTYGYMEASRWIRSGSKWCYLSESGRMLAGEWLKLNNRWYYLDDSGYMVTGTHTIDGKVYTFSESGVLIG